MASRTASPLLGLVIVSALLLAQTVTTRGAPAQTAAEVASEPRVALVIGNASYVVGPLKNPANDAQDMAEALRGLGFRVTLHQNASHRKMIEAINAFGHDLKKGGVGLFYFAGHGVQNRSGRNFLIPVNARIEKESQLEFDAVDAGRVLAAMDDAGNRVNLLVLDACRDNPFRSFRVAARGLAQIEAAQGTYIAFATAPGSVALDGDGRNGLYTRHLLESLKRPDSDIDKVFRRVTAEVSRATGGKQVPWVSSSLTGDFAFRANRAAVAASPAALIDPSANDRAFWDQVKDSKSPDELNAYLEQFPNGVFAPLARARLRTLAARPDPQVASGRPGAAPPAPAPPTPAAATPAPAPAATTAIVAPTATAVSAAVAALPFVNDGGKARIEREYAAADSKLPRALALTEAGGWGAATGRATADAARAGALENCQRRNPRHPCFLAGINGEWVLSTTYTPAAIADAAIEMIRHAALDAASYSSEDRDEGVAPTTARRTTNLHAATPRTHATAKTVTTRELVELYKRGRPVVINVLEWTEGAFALPGAAWIQGMGKASLSKTETTELKAALAQVAPDTSAPLVVYCLGWDCWLSYNAALSALALGYQDVYWYRGGANAWNQARLPVVRTKLTKKF